MSLPLDLSVAVPLFIAICIVTALLPRTPVHEDDEATERAYPF